MKVLLIDVINCGRLNQLITPHLGLAYLASHMRKYNNIKDIKIVFKNYEREITSYKPDMIGITATTINYNTTKKIARFAKEKNIPVIIGGSHISLMPKSLTKDMDVGVIGEAENTITEIIELIHNKKFDKEHFAKIKGIIYYEKGVLKRTESREPITPLDNVLFPARDLLQIPKSATVHLLSSRGCPYNCVFCATKAFWGKSVRFFSAQYVIAEIKEVIKKYNPKSILFSDDLFIADKERFKKLVRLIEKEGINKKVEFYTTLRANLVTEEVMKLLKRMNCTKVSMGFESGNESVLTYLKGGNVSVKDNWNAVKLIKKYGMKGYGTMIIGSPIDTKETIMDTYNFIKNSGLDMCIAYMLTPFPGTPLWDYALKKGVVSEDMDWSKLDMFDNSNKEVFKKKIMMTENLTKDDMWKINKKFHRLEKRMELKHNIIAGIKHPGKILTYLKIKSIGFIKDER